MKEKSEKVEELEKKLANHNKTIARNIAKKREEASIYYEKANILVELDKLIKDESRLNDALKCYDSAIILAPKKSIYLADRSKLHVLLGNNDLAVEDIRKLKSLSRDNDYVLETYIKNTVEEITKLDAIQDTVNKLLDEGKIDKELAGALTAHADITARLVIQIGMQKEELTGFRKEINELKILVINLQETIKLSNEETIKLKWELKQKTDELEMQLQIIKDIETLGKENPALYSYYNTFYWNIKSFITAYEVASTNVVQKNTDKEATTASKAIFETTSLAVKAAGTLAQSIPFAGVIGLLTDFVNRFIEHVHENWKEEKFNKKMNSINTIFQKNYSSDTERDNSLMKLAYEVTRAKEQKILAPKIDSNDFSKLKNWFQEKIKEKGNESDPAVILAIEDITMLMAYLYNHEVLKNDTDITTQLIDIVKRLDVLIAPSINFQFAVIKYAMGEEIKTLLDKIDKGMWSKKTVGFDAGGKEVEEFLTKSYIQELFGRLASQEDADNTRMFIFKIICEKISKGEENIKANAKKCAVEFTKQYPNLVIKMANENPELKEYAVLAQKHINTAEETIEFTSGANKNFEDIKKAIAAKELKTLHKKIIKGEWNATLKSKGKEVEEFLSNDYMMKLFGKAMSKDEVEKGKMVIFEIICEETSSIIKNNKPKPQVDCIEKFKESNGDLLKKIINEYPQLFKDKSLAEKYISDPILNNDETDLIGIT